MKNVIAKRPLVSIAAKLGSPGTKIFYWNITRKRDTAIR